MCVRTVQIFILRRGIYMKLTSAILVSQNLNVDRNKEMASYSCSCCGNRMTVQASLAEPYCVHCGAENKKLRSNAVAFSQGRHLLKTNEQELAHVKCPCCNLNLIMDNKTVANHSAENTGHLHCPVCSYSITFASADDAVDPASIEKPEGDEEGCADNSMPPKQKVVIENPENNTTAKVKLKNVTTGPVTFVATAGSVLCMRGNIAIASLETEKPVQTADALNAVSETEDFDLEKTLESNEFDLAEVEVNVDEHVAADAEKLVEDQVVEETAKLLDRTKQSIALALAGINRNMFGSTNILVQSVVATLTKAGIPEETAEQLAQEACEECIDDMAEEVARVTNDLLAKSDDVRNELATTVASVKPMQVTASTNSFNLTPFSASQVTAGTKQPEKGDSTVKQILGNRKLFS